MLVIQPMPLSRIFEEERKQSSTFPSPARRRPEQPRASVRELEPGVVAGDFKGHSQDLSFSFVPLNGLHAERFFIHLCSGPARSSDLCDAMQAKFYDHGFSIFVVRIDPLADGSDLLQLSVISKILDLLHGGRVVGGAASPPCSTISAALHKPLGFRHAPRPLRTRKNPWDCIDERTPRETLKCDIGSVLFLVCLGLLGEIGLLGGWIMLEHPADRGSEPFPSFFATDLVQQFATFFSLQYHVVDQCRFEAPSRKPTGLLMPADFSEHIRRRCNHRSHEQVLIGFSNNKRDFKTTAAAKYPAAFCHALATCCTRTFARARAQGRDTCFEKYFGHADRKAGVPQLPFATSWRWQEPRAGFLAEKFEACHSAALHSHPRKIQF